LGHIGIVKGIWTSPGIIRGQACSQDKPFKILGTSHLLERAFFTQLGMECIFMITFGMEGEKTGRRGSTSPNQGGSGEGIVNVFDAQDRF
jgi:hypothetical protein